jgi:DGQHR domain-containing protein
LPVPVAGFVAESLELQRDQFLRVNTVSPLPTALVNELLPEVDSAPSPRLSAKKLPSALVDMMNQDSESPFKGLIRRASTPSGQRRDAVVTDTSLVEAFKESLESPSGALFPYRNLATNTTDTSGIRLLLLTYWTAVAETFPQAWGLPPTQSRLMGGVGIRSMSRLMERVMTNVDIGGEQAVSDVKQELALIADMCRWTDGTWPEINIPALELQNTPRHISMLSNFLVRAYVQTRGSH